MRKDGTIDIEEELKIIRNNLIILSETLPKLKEMFVIHNTNRIERVLDELVRNTQNEKDTP